MKGFTERQLEAIRCGGNLVVSAGAGTGKTRTLVERCLRLVIEEGASLESMLMVTFTEAAAAEMRARVRRELRLRAEQRPGDDHLAQQLALLDGAWICTLHSFCLQLAREHFDELRLDPQFSVLDDHQARPLIRGTLDAIFEAYYSGTGGGSDAVRGLIRGLGRGVEERIRRLVWKLHAYSQSLPDPEGWLEAQRSRYERVEPDDWHRLFAKSVAAWRDEWIAVVRELVSAAPAVALCREALQRLPGSPSLAEASAAVRAVAEADSADSNWPRGSKGIGREPLRSFFEEAAFLGSVAPDRDGEDPLAQDWDWSRRDMSALISLTVEFGEAFGRAKRDAGGVDFADLEQGALRLLRVPGIAREWHARLSHVFVDEYQDINDVQDTIVRTLSGSLAGRSSGSLFLVGDAKQSIYRFRLANPRVFAGYGARWREDGAEGRRVMLNENFRSSRGLLEFVNAFCGALMRGCVGGVDYEELEFGVSAERSAGTGAAGEPPCVEMHLVARSDADAEVVLGEGEPEGGATISDLAGSEREARLLASRLVEMKRTGHPVWDEVTKRFRPVEWHDMAVLMRSPSGRVESFAKEFARAGVPLVAARDGFFGSLEVSDLVNLLRLLDNPLQDVPLLAVLRSPVVGLSVDELVEIRAHNREKSFWNALTKYYRANIARAGAWAKVDVFVRQFTRWRALARRRALSYCLDAIMVETHYEAMLLADERRGQERGANARKLVDLARQFDPHQRQGLYRFLRFVEMQEAEELDLEPAPAAEQDAVRLMSIHKSKGLEFPVVAVAGLGTRFNERDLQEPVLINETHGLCPKISPPGLEQSYPSLPYWVSRRIERRELRGEELRLLYVALTRARDALVLVGSVGRKKPDVWWGGGEAGPLSTSVILDARSHLDWLLAWLPTVTQEEHWRADGWSGNEFLRWQIYDGAAGVFSEPEPVAARAIAVPGRRLEGDAELVGKLKQTLAWRYPFREATVEPAKTSVSALRGRQRREGAEETAGWFEGAWRRRGRRGGLTAAQSGSAHHLLMQYVEFEDAASVAGLKATASRLVSKGLLTKEEASSLDFEGLAVFWKSPVGAALLSEPELVHREIPFTASFSPLELARCGLKVELPANEFMVVQGVVDLALVGPKEICVVDFKTDECRREELEEKRDSYAPQLKMYASALERIYGRPVTGRWLYFVSCRQWVGVD